MAHPPIGDTAAGPLPLEMASYTVARGIAVASISLGFFSIVIFFWHPFSSMLSGVGLCLAVYSLFRGVKGGLNKEPLVVVGLCLCSFSLTVVLTLNQVLRFVQWEH